VRGGLLYCSVQSGVLISPASFLLYKDLSDANFSIQDSPIHSERTLVHKQPQDPRRSTNDYSAQWNKKVENQILKKITLMH
jgi:hypothetical protein